jgi:hypothetical protein
VEAEGGVMKFTRQEAPATAAEPPAEPVGARK